MQSWIFSIITPVFSVTWHDPSEIILICWSAAQETFIFVINVGKSFHKNIKQYNYDHFCFRFQVHKNSIWFKYNFCNIINVFTVIFMQINVPLLYKSTNFSKINTTQFQSFLNVHISF